MGQSKHWCLSREQVRMGYGTDRRGGAAVYPGIPCTGAGMASCDLHPQTPVYKWNLKAVERGWGKGSSSSWEPSMTTAGFAKIFLQIELGCFQDFLGRVMLQTRGAHGGGAKLGPGAVPGHSDQQGTGKS